MEKVRTAIRRAIWDELPEQGALKVLGRLNSHKMQQPTPCTSFNGQHKIHPHFQPNYPPLIAKMMTELKLEDKNSPLIWLIFFQHLASHQSTKSDRLGLTAALIARSNTLNNSPLTKLYRWHA